MKKISVVTKHSSSFPSLLSTERQLSGMFSTWICYVDVRQLIEKIFIQFFSATKQLSTL